MSQELFVYVDLEGQPYLVGRLWARRVKNRESATFEYDNGWLENPARFALEPAFALGGGPQHTQGRALFGSSCTDRPTGGPPTLHAQLPPSFRMGAVSRRRFRLPS